MPNVYKNMSQKAKDHWKDYTKNYNRTKYRIIAVRLDRVKDADVIKFLDGQPEGAAGYLREVARKAAK